MKFTGNIVRKGKLNDPNNIYVKNIVNPKRIGESQFLITCLYLDRDLSIA